MSVYKFTGIDGSSCHGGTGRWTLGRWRSVRGPLVACRNGLHLCRADQLVPWLAPALWEAEVEGEVLDAGNKLVARRARIVRRVEAWNERTARIFAADSAERVLPIFEAAHPGDSRPREAIAVARRCADGLATVEELAAAGDAAWTAARAAGAFGPTGDAAWDAGDAAWAATWAAATGDAAWAAGDAGDAGDAAWAAARAAGDAESAARSAARAAGDAAKAAERSWQSEHLLDLLGLP